MSGEADHGFVHRTRALRVVFGAGAARRLADELDAMGMARAMVITTPRRPATIQAMVRSLGDRVAGEFDGSRLHVPADVARSALDRARGLHADGLVPYGGGSAIGVAKAVALETGLPILALPTTYSGSEMTAVWGVTEGGRKRTGRDDRVAPRVVVYDPELTVSLPPDASAASGINAVAHAVEALYAADASPLSSLLAEEGIRALARALPVVVRTPADVDARAGALRGAHFAGWALDLTSMGLHHKLAHVLGGTFDLPHARVHAALLPYVAAFNAPAAPGAMSRVARALGAADAPTGLFALGQALGVGDDLRSLGLRAEDLDRAAAEAVKTAYPNPRPVDEHAVRAILAAAWEGGSPLTAP